MKVNSTHEVKRILDFVNHTMAAADIEARLQEDFTKFKR